MKKIMRTMANWKKMFLQVLNDLAGLAKAMQRTKDQEKGGGCVDYDRI